MARCDECPEDHSARASLAVRENWLWKLDKRLFEPVDDLGFEDRVVFGRTMGISETVLARKLLCIPRGQVYSDFVVRPCVQNRCEASRMKLFKIVTRYLRSDRELRCHVDDFDHALRVPRSDYAAASMSVAAPICVFRICNDAPKLDSFSHA